MQRVPEPAVWRSAGWLLLLVSWEVAGGRLMAALLEICCDCCPLVPTCEEENDFLRDIGLADEWGESDEYRPNP